MNTPARVVPLVRLAAALFLVAGCDADLTLPPATSSDPNVAEWRFLNADVLSARHSAHAFWTGTEVLVLGGNAAKPRCPPGADCIPDEDELLSDGAAFNPLDGTWRDVSPAPVPLGDATGAIVDGELFVWVHEAGQAGGDRGAFLGYEIAADRWEELPAPPGPAEGLRLIEGSLVVAYRGSQEAGILPDLAYDPVLEAWRELPLDPLAPAYDRAVVWTGRELILLGIRMDPMRPPNAAPVYSAAALDPAEGEWRRLPDSQVTGWNPSWFWTAGSVVNPSLGSADGGEVNGWGRSYPFGGMLTPPGTWTPLPNVPPGRGDYTGLSVAGPEHAVSTEGWVLHVPTKRWTPLDRPPEAPDAGAAVVWAGDRLMVWGGVAWLGDDPTVLASGWSWHP